MSRSSQSLPPRLWSPSVPMTFNSVGVSRCSWLTDDLQHIETSLTASFNGSCSLGVRKVGRYSDYSIGNICSQMLFSLLLQVGQYQRGEVYRRVVTAIEGKKKL